MRYSFLCTLVLAQCAHAQSGIKMQAVDSIPLERGAEIIAHDETNQQLFIIGGGGASVLSLESQLVFEEFPETYQRNGESWEPTSVAIDPNGRGFGVITWIPQADQRATTQGILQFFDTESFEILTTIEVGHHQDCVVFSLDGSLILIANENEPVGNVDLAGGVSIIDVTSFERIEESTILERISFEINSPELSSLRISSTNIATPLLDVEPEYIAPISNGIWVSLQENNGIAFFDFADFSWSNVLNLGTSNAPLDPFDNDQIDLRRGLGIEMLYQPDTVVAFEADGAEFLLLANEGEGGDTDSIELGEAIVRGLLDPKTVSQLSRKLSKDERIAIQKLRISTIDGDRDGDGDIDVPTTLGARGISILSATSGELIWESREQFEVISSMIRPDLYNHGDTRSDRSGPEPEGLDIGYVDGRALGFVGLERAHMIFMYDLTDPTNPELLDVAALDESCYPEGLKFVTHNQRSYLYVAAEGCNELFILEVLRSN
jgi:Choice-of-anchor I domain